MSREMATAYGFMTQDMSGKLSNYFYSLQHRYGDPRVYAMQQQEMRMEQASVAHQYATTRADVLRTAYDKNRESAREGHDSRMRNFPATRPRS
jgi:hypothetical protein